ncbi:MAG: cell division protein ZapE [Microbacteriaceae bacterium]|nr:cell division protein ZapE [Microbacteriaceae bacterium]
MSFSDITPTISGAEIIKFLVPPPIFQDTSFDNYLPDAAYPSQARAVALLRTFLNPTPVKRSFFGKKAADAPESLQTPGVYLDGGFGVGKTHLLASLWHTAKGRKYFGTFMQYTALVGAIGYQKTVDLLTGASFIAIDEFELDDPGDTMMMTRLLRGLMDSGTKIAATSNTEPNALGEGRFAAQDFIREISAMSANFTVLRIDGEDYRHRESDAVARVVSTAEVEEWAAQQAKTGAVIAITDFDSLVKHLESIHPARYAKIAEMLAGLGITDVHELKDQSQALRFVALVDRLYDSEVSIVASGIPLSSVFSRSMLAGGYKKKYLRAVSRLFALTSE